MARIPHASEPTERVEQSRKLDTLHRRLLDTGLLAFVLLVSPALVASVTRGWQPVMALHALVFTTFVAALALRDRVGYRPRAVVFTSGLLAVGLGGLWTYGLAGMGTFLITLAILFSAMLLHRVYLISMATIALFGFASVGIAFVLGMHPQTVDFNAYMTRTASWATAVLTLSTVTAAILGLRRLSEGLREAVAGLAERTDELAEANRSLHAEIEARRAAEHFLSAEKEKAQVTLQSIGDAVITTDSECRVEYLNPVASTMTGWPLDEAIGRPIEEVFQIIDEQTHEAAEQPVRTCLERDEVVGLANGVALVGRHGERYLIRDSAAPIRQPGGDLLGAVLVVQDATRERMILREAQHQAAHDPLTGLINRREFEIRLERALQSAQDHSTEHSLCYLDLDRFKQVNDLAGHHAGDALLRKIAATLENRVRARDSLARLGGDEFGLLLENCPPEEAHRVGNKLIGAVRDTRFKWNEREFDIGISVGVVAIRSSAISVTQLLRQADNACYAAKDLGRNRVAFYAASDDPVRHLQQEQKLAAKLRDALENDDFSLYRQPIFPVTPKGPTSRASDPRTDRPKHDRATPPLYEVLLRLNSSEMALPGEFIPVAEKVGLMPEIDRWVIRHSFDAIAEKRDPSLGSNSAGLSINLSGVSLNDTGLSPFVQNEITRSGVAPSRICFEITETAAIENRKRALKFIQEMRALGFRFALDDFGSGLSSLAYLKQLPVDYLKIDGQFVREIDASPTDRAMVKAICELGHTLDITTIAEYVENPKVMEMLGELGVDYAQGYSLGEPRRFA